MNCHLTVIFWNVFSLVLNVNADDWNAEQWINIVGDREIFVDGKIKTMRDLYNAAKSNDNQNMDWFIRTNPNVMYTTIKCKYADAVVDILQTFYELYIVGMHIANNHRIEGIYSALKSPDDRISYIKTIRDFLSKLKPHVVKIIYSLFFYSDLYRPLRTSDQSLLRSMISINLFLHYDKMHEQNYDYYEYKNHSIHESFLDMVGLIERFRFKNCYVENPYTNYDTVMSSIVKNILINTDVIAILLDPKLEYLGNLTSIVGPVVDDGYDENMYSQEFLLFGDLMQLNDSFTETVKTLHKGKHESIKHHYARVLSTHDIKEIFEFQNLLIETIKEVLFRQINYLLVSSADKVELQIVLRSFIEFCDKIMPSNCLTKACDSAKTFRNLFIYTTDSESEIIFLETEEQTTIQLQNAFNDQYWYIEEVLQNKSLAASTLVNQILKSNQLKSFSQVIKLLSYDPKTNRNYNIFKYMNFKYHVNDTLPDRILKEYMHSFRIDLLIFREGLETPLRSYDNNNSSVAESSSGSGIEKLFSHVLSCAIKIYNKFDRHDGRNFHDTLQPLMIHLYYDKSVVRLGHMLHLTVSTIENYLFREYGWVHGNLHIYLKHVRQLPTQAHQELTNKFLKIIRENVLVEDDINEEFAWLFVTYDPEILLPDIDGDLKFYWNGTDAFASDILRSLTRSMIDYQDLVGYRLFTIKWFIAKILAKLLYVLRSYGDPSSLDTLRNEYRNVLNTRMDEFVALKFPPSVMLFATKPIEVFRNILRDSNDDRHVKIAKEYYIEILSVLGVTNTTSMSYGSMDNVCDCLQKDLGKFHDHLNVLSYYDDSFLETNDNLSMVIFPVEN